MATVTHAYEGVLLLACDEAFLSPLLLCVWLTSQAASLCQAVGRVVTHRHLSGVTITDDLCYTSAELLLFAVVIDF